MKETIENSISISSLTPKQKDANFRTTSTKQTYSTRVEDKDKAVLYTKKIAFDLAITQYQATPQQRSLQPFTVRSSRWNKRLPPSAEVKNAEVNST